MVFSFPSKVFCYIILKWMKDPLNKQLRCNQAGFRKGRSCIDSIATLREITEPSYECSTALYMHLIDF